MILVESPVISTQVVSEFINVVRRILKLPKQEVLVKCTELLGFGELFCVNMNTLDLASDLIKKYDFQIFDAIIVASALEAGCDILYSEDLQHKLLIENQLTVINPFV